jgi:hypothetical protein
MPISKGIRFETRPKKEALVVKEDRFLPGADSFVYGVQYYYNVTANTYLVKGISVMIFY